MIQRAFEISIKAVNKNITVSEHAMGVLLTPRIEKTNKNVLHVANIGILLFFVFRLIYNITIFYLHKHSHSPYTV